MSGLPVAIKAVVAVVMVVSIWRAFYGPPPERRDMPVARLWGAAAAVLYGGALFAVADGRRIAWLLLFAGVVALCVAFWHARGDDGGGGGGDDPGDDTGPIDWDRFDRARRDWDRPHVPA